MKRVRFRDPSGAVRNGEWSDGRIEFGGRTYDPGAVDVLPPVEPSKVVCIGRNYADHAAEHDADVPDRPLLFLKGPNAVAGHGDAVELPDGTAGKRVEHEAELGAVIGEQCRHVPEDRAMDVVAGFTCVNDLSNRDDQREEQNWIRGKAFDGAAPMGPVVATPDEVPVDAAVRLRVNGETKQDGSRADMVFPVPELVAEITRFLTLEPGDVIATGTPEDVGPLDDGDRVEVEVEGVGTLEHTVHLA
ncbi:2-hydroxyhepta-2,4-diene-1,7-dioate isomerase [Halobacteriales archaeon QS_8_69_26]|nr:MAG: 2-hydroxyhepta-2,4-diene-1,7-dioate isomerase [Halobacteriales archaeon QS_8_69_26]